MGWWESFFDTAWANLQGALYDEETTRRQADAIEGFLGLDVPSEILDVPCGNGRHSLELAARGHSVTGVDRSERQLDDARRAAAERGLDVSFEHRDMRDLPWRDRFQAAVCWWGSFGYFSDAGNLTFLSAVRNALADGGRLVVDTHCVESLLPRLTPRRWDRVGDVLMLQESEWDHGTGRMETEWTFVAHPSASAPVVPSREGTAHSSIRLYTYRELLELASEAGFSEVTGYGSLEGAEFALGSARLHLVARR